MFYVFRQMMHSPAEKQKLEMRLIQILIVEWVSQPMNSNSPTRSSLSSVKYSYKVHHGTKPIFPPLLLFFFVLPLVWTCLKSLSICFHIKKVFLKAKFVKGIWEYFLKGWIISKRGGFFKSSGICRKGKLCIFFTLPYLINFFLSMSLLSIEDMPQNT